MSSGSGVDAEEAEFIRDVMHPGLEGVTKAFEELETLLAREDRATLELFVLNLTHAWMIVVAVLGLMVCTGGIVAAGAALFVVSEGSEIELPTVEVPAANPKPTPRPRPRPFPRPRPRKR